MKKRSPVNTEHPFISGQRANLLSEIGDIIPASLLRRWGMVFGISHRDTGIWAIALWNLKLFHNFRIAQAGQSGINIAGSNAVGMRGQHQVCGGAGDIFPVTVAVFRGGNYRQSVRRKREYGPGNTCIHASRRNPGSPGSIPCFE